MNFLEEKIITRFSVPVNITRDNSKAFSSIPLNEFCLKYGIFLSHSSIYYPQGNGLAKYNNENIMNIVKKIVGDNNMVWDSNIKYFVLDDSTTTKIFIRKTPLI